jgi:hypothetical protein
LTAVVQTVEEAAMGRDVSRKLRRSACVTIFATIGLVATGTFAWCADQAWDDCVNKDPDISIAGCTKILARGTSETVVNRANAHYNLGSQGR